jgi:hypothetical protein
MCSDKNAYNVFWIEFEAKSRRWSFQLGSTIGCLALTGPGVPILAATT